MRIQKAYMSSFGKYQNKELTLDNGINLIYGPNEAGKSTFHKFIEGMFYGFYRSHTKNKQYEEDYDRYLPWENSNQYTGILIYEHEGREYRMERNFMKRRDKVEIFDNQTGENVTESFDYDKVTKLYQPAWKHLGINKSTFKNTISISQLSSKTGEELVKEVKDKLINLGESHDEEISVKRVVDKLEDKLNNIGTATRKKTSPYGKLVVQLKELNDEKTEAKKQWKLAEVEQEQLLGYGEQLKTLEERRDLVREKLALINHEKLQKQYDEAKRLASHLAKKREELYAYAAYGQIEDGEIDRALKAIHTLQANSDRQREMFDEGQIIQDKIKALQEAYEPIKVLETIEGEERRALEEILSTYRLYEANVDQLASQEVELAQIVPSSQESMDPQIIEEDIARYLKLNELLREESDPHGKALAIGEEKHKLHLGKMKSWKLMATISSGLAVITFGISLFLHDDLVLMLLPVIMGIGAVMTLVGYKKEVGRVSQIHEEVLALKNHQREQGQRQQTLRDEQETILSQYACQHLEGLRQLKEQVNYRRMRFQDEEKRYRGLQNKIAQLKEAIAEEEHRLSHWIHLILGEDGVSLEQVQQVRELLHQYDRHHKSLVSYKEQYEEHHRKYQELEGAIKSLEEEIRVIGEAHEATTEEAFRQLIVKKRAYEQINQEIKHQETLYHQLLGTTTLEELGATLSHYEESSRNIQESKEELEALQGELVEEILEVTREISNRESSLVALTGSCRPLVDIEEDIHDLTTKRTAYDQQIRALTMARDAIDHISKDIQNNFAPKLNEKVSDIVCQITGDKYQDIKINPNMDILAYESQGLQLTSVDKLSKGTIDQMYFGLRLSLIDIMQEEVTLPLILDDCFTQYDDDRLGHVLQVLGKLDRQIILLTCHQREGKLLDRMDIPYHQVEL